MSKTSRSLDSETDQRAAEYVLGTLEGDARAEFGARLETEPLLRAAVQEWEERLAGLGNDQGAAGPPDGLWDKIDARIDALDPQSTMTIRAGRGEWSEIGPGVEWKILHVDQVCGQRSLLLKLAPGACYPAHDHSGVEECMIIEGDMIIGDLQLHAGDYHVAQAGTRHEAVTSEKGGLVFIRQAA